MVDNQESGAAGSNRIKIKVVGNDGHQVVFRLKMTALMGKLKKIYSEKVGMPAESLRFFFNFKRINDDETAEKLGLKNNDVIQVYPELGRTRSMPLLTVI